MTIVDVLRRASIEVVTAALGESPVRGSHGIAVVADAKLDDVRGDDFDALVLPGGMPGSKTLRDDERVLSMVRNMREREQARRRDLRGAHRARGGRSARGKARHLVSRQRASERSLRRRARCRGRLDRHEPGRRNGARVRARARRAFEESRSGAQASGGDDRSMQVSASWLCRRSCPDQPVSARVIEQRRFRSCVAIRVRGGLRRLAREGSARRRGRARRPSGFSRRAPPPKPTSSSRVAT